MSLTPYLEGFGNLEIISKEQMHQGLYRYCGSDFEENYDIYELEEDEYTTGKYFAVKD